MPLTTKAWTDERLDRIISLILRTGVVIACVVVLAGGILFLLEHGGAVPEYRTFRGEPVFLNEFNAIVHGVFSLRARSWIQFGLLLLVLTPITRVAFCVFAFIRQRDRTYIVLTLIVLSVLVYSLWGH